MWNRANHLNDFAFLFLLFQWPMNFTRESWTNSPKKIHLFGQMNFHWKVKVFHWICVGRCQFSVWHFPNGKSKTLRTQTHQRCFAQSMRSRFRTIVPWLIWVVLFKINAFTNVEIKALYGVDITRAMHTTAHAAYAMQTKAYRAFVKYQHNGQIIKRILSNKQ